MEKTPVTSSSSPTNGGSAADDKQPLSEMLKRLSLVVGAVMLVVIIVVAAVASTAGFLIGREDRDASELANLRSDCGIKITQARNSLQVADSIVTDQLVTGLRLAVTGGSEEQIQRQAVLITEAQNNAGRARATLRDEDAIYEENLAKINDGQRVQC